MRGQDFGIHQCLRKTLAWSPCISCQSCQQPHRRSSLGARLAGYLPAGSTSPPSRPPAGASPSRRDRTGPRPAPPVPARPAGTAPALLYQNKHNSRCFLTRLSPEKAASLYKGFSVGISLLKTINIIRNLLPL